MAGFDLKEGKYDDRKVTDDELWSALACVFSVKSKNDSSYKFGFLKSILNNLDNADSNLMLTFDQLFTTFGEIYWALVLKYGLRQKAQTINNRESYIEQILHSVSMELESDNYVPYCELSAVMKRDIARQVKVKCKKYVVGALYADTDRLFYSFNRKEEWIQINPAMFTFAREHMADIEELNYLEWARFLEHANEATVSTTYKKDTDRGFSKYRKILLEEFEGNDAYESYGTDINAFELLNDADAALSYATTVENENSRLKHEASVVRESTSALDEEAFALLDDPEALIRLLKKRREKQPATEVEDEPHNQRRWVREEVIILVVEYFRSKNFSASELDAVYHDVSNFLRRREEKLTGQPVSETFRNYAGIRMQVGRVRCLDPDTGLSGMRGTKLQKEVVQEYLKNPKQILAEAEQIYQKYS